jgi:hypothetical protein
MFGWGKKKPSWDVQYAQNIYTGLVAHNQYGDMTALKLQIPTAQHQAYQNKFLLQREMICFVALMRAAQPGTKLQPVMMAYGDLVVHKAADRGLQITRDQLAEASLDDVDKMLLRPFEWGQQWLSEFRNDPNDPYGVYLFANHCSKLFQAYEGAIEEGHQQFIERLGAKHAENLR